MADWFIATEGVKVVKDSASLWPQIITAIATTVAAFGSGFLTHYFTQQREKRAEKDKAAAERLYLATELAFLLEQYTVAWTPLLWRPIHKLYADSKHIPVLDLSGAKGDWRVLPASLIFRIRSLEMNQANLHATVSSSKYLDYPGESLPLTHWCLISGIRAFVLAAKLRRVAGLPDSPLLRDQSGTFKALRDLRRRLWLWIVRNRKEAEKAYQSMKFAVPPPGENDSDRAP